MNSTKSLEDFYCGEKIIPPKNSGVSRDIRVAQKKSDEDLATWFLKSANLDSGLREVVAQEFVRLFMSASPKTRLVLGEDGSVEVASKEIIEGIDLEQFILENPNVCLTDGNFKGLGDALVLSLILKEIDLKIQNLMVDEDDNIIRYDGNWCFANMTPEEQNRNFHITQETIESLPRLTDRYAFNWLNSSHIDYDHGMDTYFKKTPYLEQEINSAILKLFLFTPTLLNKFITHYAPDLETRSKYYIDICKSLNELREAVTFNTSFKDYLKTAHAQETLDQFKDRLKTFQATHSQFIFANDHYEIDQLTLPVLMPSLDQIDKMNEKGYPGLFTPKPKAELHPRHANPARQSAGRREDFDIDDGIYHSILNIIEKHVRHYESTTNTRFDAETNTDAKNAFEFCKSLKSFIVKNKSYQDIISMLGILDLRHLREGKLKAIEAKNSVDHFIIGVLTDTRTLLQTEYDRFRSFTAKDRGQGDIAKCSCL